MSRAAGDSRYYTFTLRNENTGRYMKDVEIKLPSSSTIVKETLAAPALLGWYYRMTRDNIVGLASVLGQEPEFMDMLTDPEWLEEYLKDNQLRPEDIGKEAARRGTREHKTLENLAKVGIEDPDEAHVRAQRLMEHSSNPFEVAIGTWWYNNRPIPLHAEKVLPAPQWGYCGTTDMIFLDADDMVEVLDLKTRRSGLGVYRDDEFQVDSYFIAYQGLGNEAHSRGVLIAYDDGTYQHSPVSVPVGSFLEVKRVWDLIQSKERR